jgi:hypothetical protein
MFGGEPTPGFGYRFFEWYGLLEYRMNHGSPEEEEVVVTKLATLASLEADVPTASGNLDTASAGPWVHNKNEIRDRLALYQYHRNELCNFFGVPPGPKMPTSGTSWSI